MLAAQRGIQNLSVDGPMVANFKLPIAHPKYQKNLKEIEE